MNDRPDNDTPSKLHRALRLYQDDKRTALGWVFNSIGMIALGVAGYAATAIMTHTTDIAVLKANDESFREALKEQKVSSEKQNDLLQQILQRLPRTP